MTGKQTKLLNRKRGSVIHSAILERDKMRLVTCQDDPLQLLLPVVKVASSAAQTQANICRDVYDVLEDLPEGDDLTLIGALSGNCYRMHRLSHVLKEIYEQESNITETVCFSLTTQLEDVFHNLQRMYKSYMLIERNFETKNLFINANRGAFVSAVLAGLSISFIEPDKIQRVSMDLKQTARKTALVTITVEPELENEQPDRRLQIKDLDAIANDREYLNVFCRRYECQWGLEIEDEERAVFTLEIPLCDQQKHLALHLNSLTDDIHFNAYTAMLSILHYRLIM